ncbi:MAG: tripartite tricarboxylate transporter substrate binding protein [Betaproteobacteria bacterium]|nr:tripartite tricarboxylate transporter substrate binding protein [Betaproteobacteria bacterium]
MNLRSLLQVVVSATLCVAAGTHAQTYPAKPVRYIMPSTGASELVGRLIAQGMTEVLGQQVFVDLRTGAGGNLGADIAAKAAPDGYTLLQVAQTHTVNASLFKNLSYDLMRDFIPVTKADISPLMLVVHPSLPVKTVGDLVKIAKAKPGAINYGSAGVGTSTYLAAELFKIMAGVNLLEVPYRGGAPAQTAVIAGEVSVYFAPIATALPFVKDRRLRGIAVGTAKRVPLLPEIPTVAESGYPDYEASNWHGIAVPAKTPKEIVAALHTAAVAAVKKPDIAKRLLELGLTPVGDTPEEFSVFLRADIEKWRKIVQQKGLTAD